MKAAAFGGVEVILLRWPAEADWRDGLARRCSPRLLLVEDGADPPEALDCLEDWVRAPASEAEVRARVGALLTRHRTHQRVPHIDADGVLRFGSARVPLPPVEVRLAGLLAEHFEAVVSSDALRRAVWPDSAPARNVLDVHMVHLRRRLARAGLVVRTLRTQGYLLEVGPGGSGPPESPSRRPPCLPFSSRGG